MPLILGIGAVAAPVIGGAIGNIASSGDREEAARLRQQALQGIMGVNTPTMEELKLILQKYNTPETITPEMEALVQQQASEMSKVQTDPRLAQAQMQALGQLQKISTGGMRPEDEAAIARIQNATAQQEQARQQSILQSMQERGQGGSGAELAARLNSSQAAANRSSAQGMDVASGASQRALQAMMNSGTLGGQIRSQDNKEKSDVAQAQDAINRWNSMNKQQVLGVNTSANNNAQQYNVGNRNRVNEANVNLGNEQTKYNSQLPQTIYNNNLQKATAGANALNSSAQGSMQNAANTQSMYSGIGQGVGTGLGGVANYQQNQNYMDILKKKNSLSGDITPTSSVALNAERDDTNIA